MTADVAADHVVGQDLVLETVKPGSGWGGGDLEEPRNPGKCLETELSRAVV